MFSGCTVPDSKETELGSSTQQTFVSAHKNSRVVLVPCCAWKHVPTAISGGVDISEIPMGCLFLQMSFQWESQKLLQGLASHELTAYLSVFDVFLTQWIMAILPKGCKSDFWITWPPKTSLCKYLNPLCKICWMWIFAWIKLLWHSCSLGDKLGWLNWFWQFLCKGLSSFKSKGFYYSYAWSCGSCEGRTYPCAQDLSLENSGDSYAYFEMALLYV